MARKGHREGCQCAVCKAMRAKVAREPAMVAVTPAPTGGVMISTLPVGTKFSYKLGSITQVYQKLNEVSGGSVVTSLTSEAEAEIITLPPGTKVQLFERTAQEDSMD